VTVEEWALRPPFTELRGVLDPGTSLIRRTANMNFHNAQNEGVVAVSVETASKIANIGRTKLYALIRDGLLPARKCGRRTLILISDLQALLHNLPRIGGRVE
jgi:excisionase family DNA binding protein